MCQINNRLEYLPEELTTYKVLLKGLQDTLLAPFGTIDADSPGVVYPFIYKIGESYEEHGSTLDANREKLAKGYFHSFLQLSDAIEYRKSIGLNKNNSIIVKCTIPENTLVYHGLTAVEEFGGGRYFDSVASTKITIERELNIL